MEALYDLLIRLFSKQMMIFEHLKVCMTSTIFGRKIFEFFCGDETVAMIRFVPRVIAIVRTTRAQIIHELNFILIYQQN